MYSYIVTILVMVYAFAACLVILLILLLSEYLWRKKVLKHEHARKFVHIVTACWIAVWPMFLSLRMIQLLSIALLVVVLIATRLKIFKSIRDVKRKSYGDISFALGIGFSAVVAPSPLLFSVAILHIGLADGLAALVGQKLGTKNRYTIFGQEKSIAGTATFAVISLCILAALLIAATPEPLLFAPVLITLPIALALAENISPYGLDNVVVPALLLLAFRIAPL